MMDIYIYIYICTQSSGIFIARTLHETPALILFHHSKSMTINLNVFNASGGASPNAQQEKKTRLEIAQQTPMVERVSWSVDLMPLKYRKTANRTDIFGCHIFRIYFA